MSSYWANALNSHLPGVSWHSNFELLFASTITLQSRFGKAVKGVQRRLDAVGNARLRKRASLPLASEATWWSKGSTKDLQPLGSSESIRSKTGGVSQSRWELRVRIYFPGLHQNRSTYLTTVETAYLQAAGTAKGIDLPTCCALLSLYIRFWPNVNCFAKRQFISYILGYPVV